MRKKQSAWSISTFVVPSIDIELGTAEADDSPFPEFRSYCRVCKWGNESLHRERQDHEYQEVTYLRTRDFGHYIEVPRSVRDDYEAERVDGDAVRRRFDACTVQDGHRGGGVREILPEGKYRSLCASCRCWFGPAGVEAT